MSANTHHPIVTCLHTRRPDNPRGTKWFVCEGWKLWGYTHQSPYPLLRARPLGLGLQYPPGLCVTSVHKTWLHVYSKRMGLLISSVCAVCLQSNYRSLYSLNEHGVNVVRPTETHTAESLLPESICCWNCYRESYYSTVRTVYHVLYQHLLTPFCTLRCVHNLT